MVRYLGVPGRNRHKKSPGKVLHLFFLVHSSATKDVAFAAVARHGHVVSGPMGLSTFCDGQAGADGPGCFFFLKIFVGPPKKRSLDITGIMQITTGNGIFECFASKIVHCFGVGNMRLCDFNLWPFDPRSLEDRNNLLERVTFSPSQKVRIAKTFAGFRNNQPVDMKKRFLIFFPKKFISNFHQGNFRVKIWWNSRSSRDRKLVWERGVYKMRELEWEKDKLVTFWWPTISEIT